MLLLPLKLDIMILVRTFENLNRKKKSYNIVEFFTLTDLSCNVGIGAGLECMSINDIEFPVSDNPKVYFTF